MNRRKIAITSAVAGVLVLGAVTTAYAIDWRSASNEWQESYNGVVVAQTRLDQAYKTYDEVKDVKPEELTPQGRVAQTSLTALVKDRKTAGLSKDAPSWTNSTPWGLRSQAKDMRGQAAELDAATDAVKGKISTVKDEKTRQTNLKARSGLESKLKEAEKLYKESNGNVDDEASRRSLKDWIDKTRSLLDWKELSEGKTYNARSTGAGKIFSAVHKAMESRSDRLEAEAAARAAEIQASYQQAQSQQSGSSYAQTRQAQSYQPSYGTSSYQWQAASQPVQQASPRYESGVDARCTVPNEVEVNTCQGAVDQGGMVDIDYYGGTTHIYSQHNGTGGAWINNLKPGDSVTFGGKEYTVNDYDEQGATTVPYNGIYAQTCNENGNHLVGLTPKK